MNCDLKKNYESSPKAIKCEEKYACFFDFSIVDYTLIFEKNH